MSPDAVAPGHALSEPEAKALLAAKGFAVPRHVVALQGEAPDLTGLRPPFAVKILSPHILHKSDAGGVRLGVQDADGVARAIAAMRALPAIAAAPIDGFLVEEMAAPGTEIVIGGLRDPQFGPAVMVGLGGVFVEVLEDVAFRLCPITLAEAEAMLDELRGAPLLRGTRGREPVDRVALTQALLAIGGADGLMLSRPDIAEIDINPLIANAAGLIAVDARVILGAPVVEPERTVAAGNMQDLFAPRSIAVYGASATSASVANTFIRRTRAFGFAGAIYPIHPSAADIEGLPAYPDLASAPEPIDYAYIAVGARHVPGILRGARGRLRFAQVISSGFGETEQGQGLQQDLVSAAREGGCRVLGPNCLGLYSPRGRVTFVVDPPAEVGTVGVLTQSGGLGTDIIKRGQWRGLRLSGLITVGNSADVSPTDLVRLYFEDPQTRVVGLYVEDIKDGRAFFDLLRSAPSPKPVVILRGGRSAHGREAAASHTGALAGSDRIWEALARQTLCVLVDTVDQFIDALLALQFYQLRLDRPTQRVVLFGNGGGTSVLATDYFAALGLDVAPFDPATRQALEALNLPPGTSVANPIDAPVRTLQERDGRIANDILELVYRHATVDAVVMHLNLAAFVGRGDVDPIDNLFAAAVEIQRRHPGRAHFAVVLRSDGSPELDDRKRAYRLRAAQARIPAFDELAAAAEALRCVRHLERHLGSSSKEASWP